MRILVCNDDGVHAPGLKALYDAVKDLGDTWVVAPLEEKSTTGHSLTLHKPIRVTRMWERFYGVSGSPADCVNVGIKEVMKAKPDVVFSGINRGANLGQDVYYSGTVSAAREACIAGIPSVAVSLVIDFAHGNLSSKKLHFASAGRALRAFLRKFDVREIPYHTLININVPDLPYSKIKGTVLARQGFRYYSGAVLKRRDHRGRDYFWIGGNYKGFKKELGTDCLAVDKHYVAVTPMKLDLTDNDQLSALATKFNLFGK